MIDLIVNGLKGIPKEIIVVVISVLPVSELRGAIPLALSFGMSMSKAFWLSVLGNLIFVAPALFFFEPISGFLRKFKIWSRFFDWVFERTQKRSEVVQKYEALGLVLFVAIPLPMTGAWSGVIAATLFKIRFRYAFIAITAGVLIAGLIVTSLCNLGLLGWRAVIH